MPNVQWSKCDLWPNSVSASPLLFVQCIYILHLLLPLLTSHTGRQASTAAARSPCYYYKPGQENIRGTRDGLDFLVPDG